MLYYVNKGACAPVLVKELGPIFNKRCKYALFTPFSYTCKSDKMGEGRKLK